MMTNITFRNVNDTLFTEFKAETARLKKNMGEAISEAIDLWLHYKKRKLDIKKVEKDADRDYWMTSAEAKEYGMIDEVLTRVKSDK